MGTPRPQLGKERRAQGERMEKQQNVRGHGVDDPRYHREREFPPLPQDTAKEVRNVPRPSPWPLCQEQSHTDTHTHTHTHTLTALDSPVSKAGVRRPGGEKSTAQRGQDGTAARISTKSWAAPHEDHPSSASQLLSFSRPPVGPPPLTGPSSPVPAPFSAGSWAPASAPGKQGGAAA